MHISSRHTPADDAGRPASSPARRRLGALLGGATTIAAVWGAALVVNRSLRRVRGPSMLPLLAPDDLLAVRPIVPGIAASLPNRGDLVVIRLDESTAVKRLVGLPGDTVVLGDGHLHVDGSWWRVPGELVDEDMHLPLGPDQVAVLGDNRRLSTDSRQLGALPLAAVERVAVARLDPWRRLTDGAGMVRLAGPRKRPAVRVITLDADDRVLLFRVRDIDGGPDQWWETPGGGIHPGESPHQAAIRELAEEVGAPHDEVVDLDHVATRHTTYRGTAVERVEHHMAVRVHHSEVSTDNWTAAERADNVTWQWFTLEGLATIREPIVPHDLTPLVEAALPRMP